MYHNSGGKEKAVEHYLTNKDVTKKQIKSTETCQKKNKNQKENIAEVGTKTWKKVWTKAVLKSKIFKIKRTSHF